MVAFAITSVAVGFAVGILSGLLGIGGGTILVALFSLFYGMSAISSTATSLFTIIPTSFSGALTHIREKTCVLGIGAAAGLGGAVTSPIGVWLASLSPEWLVLIACAAVIAYSSFTMFRKAFALRSKMRRGQKQNVDSRLQQEATHDFKVTWQTAIQGALIGMAAGLMSGYVGVGGGFLMVPLFMGILGLPMSITSGTSLIAVMILAIPGTVTQALMGNVDWLVGIAVAVGSIPGAILGAKLVKRVPELALRFGYAVFLLAMAALLVIEQFV